MFLEVPVSRILFFYLLRQGGASRSDSNLSRPVIAHWLERFSSTQGRGTILHRGKDLAVSPELNRFVTVRTYVSPHAGVTRYLAPRYWAGAVFGLSSPTTRSG